MEFRVRSSGELKNQGGIRKLNPNISLPRVWGEDIYEVLGIDPVLESTRPTPTGDYKTVVRNGAVQDADNDWVQAWVEQDMFSDTTEDGVTTTKAEHEAAYTARRTADSAANVRSKRDAKLTETDWTGMSDVTMASDMTTYRQALRDITSHANFPNLEDADWPEAP